MRTFGRGPSGPNDSEGRGWLDFILLPYTAMAIAMLLVLLLLFLRRIVPARKQTLRRPKQDACQEFPEHAAARDERGERQGWGQPGRGE